jgi:hypothetical protein
VFFELRQYRVREGKREDFVRLMEEEIIPFQIGQGMVVVGSFVGSEEEDLYVWIRRFDSEEQRKELYERVYQSDFWKNEMSPRVGEMLIREKSVITRIAPTPKSVIR